jgi:hypothetical protein
MEAEANWRGKNEVPPSSADMHELVPPTFFVPFGTSGYIFVCLKNILWIEGKMLRRVSSLSM